MERQFIHAHFVDLVSQKLEKEGYTFLDREVTIPEIQINGKSIKIDLLMQKNGKPVPIECGRIEQPRIERVHKLKEMFGGFKHVCYGKYKMRPSKKRKSLPELELTSTLTITLQMKNGKTTIPAHIRRRLGLDINDLVQLDIDRPKKSKVE